MFSFALSKQALLDKGNKAEDVEAALLGWAQTIGEGWSEREIRRAFNVIVKVLRHGQKQRPVVQEEGQSQLVARGKKDGHPNAL